MNNFVWEWPKDFILFFTKQLLSSDGRLAFNSKYYSQELIRSQVSSRRGSLLTDSGRPYFTYCAVITEWSQPYVTGLFIQPLFYDISSIIKDLKETVILSSVDRTRGMLSSMIKLIFFPYPTGLRRRKQR